MFNWRQKIDKNSNGRDFVIGDLHGMYDLLQDLLTKINFDKTKDRLFSVGDLVDRGPKSPECLALIKEPWFFAIMGNHEQMLCSSFEGATYLHYSNGGKWLDEHPETDALKHDVLALPFMISLERADGTWCHIVHSQFSESSTSADMQDDEFVNKVLMALDYNYMHSCMWSRYIFNSFYGRDKDAIKNIIEDKSAPQIQRAGLTRAPGINHEDLFFTGHTPLRCVVKVNNHIDLDTGAVFTRSKDSRLTCIDVNTLELFDTLDLQKEVFDIDAYGNIE